MARSLAVDTFTCALSRELCCLQDRLIDQYRQALNPLELELAVLREKLASEFKVEDDEEAAAVAVAKGKLASEFKVKLEKKAVRMATVEAISVESREKSPTETKDATQGLTTLHRWESLMFGVLTRDFAGTYRCSRASTNSSSVDTSQIDEYWGMHATWSLRPDKDKNTEPASTGNTLPVARSMKRRKFASTAVQRSRQTATEHHGDVLRDDHYLPILQHCTLNPDSVERCTWALVGVVALALDLIMIPLQAVGIVRALPKSLDAVTFTYWLIDFPCQMLTGVHRDGLIDLRPTVTVRAYAQTWMVPDLIFLLLDLVNLLVDVDTSYEASHGGLRIARLVRMLRVFRAHKLRSVQMIIETYIFSTHFLLIVKVVWLVLCMLTLNHWVACAWYGIAANSHEQDTWLDSYAVHHGDNLHGYLAALHWSLCQFSPATNNIAPQNAVERGFANCVAIFGLVIFSSFISSVTNAVNQLKELKMSRFRERIRMQDFLRRMKVSTDLGRRIQIFFKSSFKKCCRPTLEKDITAFLELPQSLRIRLHQEMYYPALQLTVMYTLCDADSLELLVQICHTAMSEMHYYTGQDVFIDGSACNVMYYVKAGSLQYYPLSARQMHKVGDLVEGDLWSMNRVSSCIWLSEAALWLRWVHAGRLEALCPCHVVALSSDSVRDTVSKSRGPLFRTMRTYAILFVSYFEELNERNYSLTDLPIPAAESSMLVEKAQRMTDALSLGILKNLRNQSDERAQLGEKFWLRWTRVVPTMGVHKALFSQSKTSYTGSIASKDIVERVNSIASVDSKMGNKPPSTQPLHRGSQSWTVQQASVDFVDSNEGDGYQSACKITKLSL